MIDTCHLPPSSYLFFVKTSANPVFIHFDDCEGSNKRFPNAVMRLQSIQLDIIETKKKNNPGMNSIIFPSAKRNVSGIITESIPIYIQFLEKVAPTSYICKFHVNEPLMSTGRYCLAGHYIADFLQSRLNFVQNKYGSVYYNGYGYINLAGFVYPHGCFADSLFLLNKDILTAMYCNFEPAKTLQINFAAWWEPFQLELWFFMGGTSLVLGLVGTFWIYKLKHFEVLRKNISSKLASESLNVVRCILRQDEDTKNIILLVFSFTMILVTSLYENIITSQLIVPDNPTIYLTLADLVENGYKFRSNVIQTIVNSVNTYLVRIGKANLMSYKNFERNPELHSLSDISNKSLRNAYIGYATENDWKHHTTLLTVGSPYKCHTVKDPVSEVLAFVSFQNTFTHEQMRLMLVMRDYGFLAWWDKLVKYSDKLAFSILRRQMSVEEISDSYLSNLNIVPIYSIWMILVTFSLVIFLTECSVHLRLRDNMRNLLVYCRSIINLHLIRKFRKFISSVCEMFDCVFAYLRVIARLMLRQRVKMDNY
jgi:hypothetical protein